MASSVRVEIDEAAWREADRLLAQLEAEIRLKSARNAISKACDVVVRETKKRLPKPGYPGDKPGLKPLRDTVGKRVVIYDGVIVGVVGPQYPAGAHGHLVEQGHELVAWGKSTGRRVEGRHYMQQAVEATRAEQEAAFLNAIRLDIAKVTG